MSNSNLALAIKLLTAGDTQANIAMAVGVSKTTVKNWAKLYGCSPSVQANGYRLQKELTDKKRLYVKQQYLAGSSMKSISLALGFLGTRTVRKILNDFGITYSPKASPISDETYSALADTIVNEYASGTSRNQLMLKYGNVAKSILRNRGIRIRGYSEAKHYSYLPKRKRLTERGISESFLLDVRRLTRAMYDLYKDQINPNGLLLGRQLYHLDHVYSISQARHNPANLKNPINIWELCHPANLRVITSVHNLTKGAKIGCTAKQLRQRITAWNLEYFDPYWINDASAIKLIGNFYGYYDNYDDPRGYSLERRYYKTSNCP